MGLVKKNPLLFSGAFTISILFLFSFFAPVFSRYDPSEINIPERLLPPSSEHYMGTDSLGRDVFSRFLYGGRISMTVGLVSVSISVLIGVVIGATSGYMGKGIDVLLMRFTDLMLCFPVYFLILAMIAFLGPNILNIMLIIGIFGWMGIARLIRAEVLSLKEREFVLAAKSFGAGKIYILIRHIIPNSIGPVIVSAILGVGGAILTESSLSFLGLGVQPPTPSWGNMLMEGKATLGVAWHLIVFPGLAIFITVLGFNLLGEGLRNTISPRKK